MKKEDVQKLITKNWRNYNVEIENSNDISITEYTELYAKVLFNLKRIEIDENYEIIEPSMTDFKDKVLVDKKNICFYSEEEIIELFITEKQLKVQSEEFINTQVELTSNYILEELYGKNEIKFLETCIKEDKQKFIKKWVEIIINERTSLKQCIKEFQEDVIEYFNIEQLQKEYRYDILSSIEKVEEENYKLKYDEEEIIEDIKEQFDYGELLNRVTQNYIIRNHTYPKEEE